MYILTQMITKHIIAIHMLGIIAVNSTVTIECQYLILFIISHLIHPVFH